jgi:hypothetical protein
LAGCYENDTEGSYFFERGKFIDSLSNHNLLKDTFGLRFIEKYSYSVNIELKKETECKNMKWFDLSQVRNK